MNKLIDLIIFIMVVAILWWALTTILAALAVPSVFQTIAVVVFILIAVIAFLDYFRSGRWFWNRP
jgi:hypothetical protein